MINFFINFFKEFSVKDFVANAQATGLVTCGKGRDVSSACKIDGLPDILNSFAGFVLKIIFPAAFIFGLAMVALPLINLFGDSNASTLEIVKRRAKYLLWGTVCSVGAFMIIKSILVGIGFKGADNISPSVGNSYNKTNSTSGSSASPNTNNQPQNSDTQVEENSYLNNKNIFVFLKSFVSVVHAQSDGDDAAVGSSDTSCVNGQAEYDAFGVPCKKDTSTQAGTNNTQSANKTTNSGAGDSSLRLPNPLKDTSVQKILLGIANATSFIFIVGGIICLAWGVILLQLSQENKDNITKGRKWIFRSLLVIGMFMAAEFFINIISSTASSMFG